MGPTHRESVYRKDAIISGQFLFRAYLSCLALGARRPVLLKALKLNDAQLRNPLSRFDCSALTILCRATSYELGRTDASSIIGRAMLPQSFSDIGYASLFQDSYEDVLNAMLAAMDLGHGDIPLSLQKSKHDTCLQWENSPQISADMVNVIFSAIIGFFDKIEDKNFPLIKEIHFTQPKPEHGEEAMNSVPSFYNQPRTRIILNHTVMALTNPQQNKAVVRAARQQEAKYNIHSQESATFARLGYNYLFHLLDKSGLSLKAAAETFGVAERTLRRKLVSEDTSFRQILEQVRRDTSQLYFMEGALSLSDIATRLGYSELSAFTRAYTSWHGHPPSHDKAHCLALAA